MTSAARAIAWSAGSAGSGHDAVQLSEPRASGSSTPPRSPFCVDRNWPPDEPCENRPASGCNCASSSARVSGAPATLVAEPCRTSLPPSTTGACARTSRITVLSVPTLIVSPGSSCGVKLVQQPPRPARCAEFTPPSAGDAAGSFLFLAVAIVTPSRTTETAALFAKPASSTSDVFEVTVIALSTPATAAGAGVGRAAYSSAAAASGAHRRADGRSDGSDIREFLGWGTADGRPRTAAR